MENKEFNDKGKGYIELSKLGIEKVEKFIEDNNQLYLLICAYVLHNLFDLLKEELDEKDYKRIKESLERGT